MENRTNIGCLKRIINKPFAKLTKRQEMHITNIKYNKVHHYINIDIKRIMWKCYE